MTLPRAAVTPGYPYRWREQLLHLLAEAAELEHGVVCVYLYAAFSLKRSPDEGLSPHELEAVRRWHKTLFHIARDEMAHLVTVNNLIVAIGGSPHFNRPNFPVAPGYIPGGLSLELTPFSRETLDTFVMLERSQQVAADDAADAADTAPRRGAPAEFLFPAAVDYRTIGAFYETLKSAFADAAASLGEPALFAGTAHQLTAEGAGLANSFDVTSLASAQRALDSIVAEGEGSASEGEDCHFGRYTHMRDEYDRLHEQNPDFAPARAVVSHPVMRRPANAAGRAYIEAPESQIALDAANALYGQLVRLLIQSYRRDGDERMQRTCVAAAIGLMHVFSDVCGHLTTLPAAAEGKARAGVSFTMLRSIEPLMQGGAERAIIAERLDELARRLDQLSPPRVFAPAAKRIREIKDAF